MAALLIPSPQGATRLFAMLGFPVGQVMAPMMMNQLFHEVAHDAVVVPVEVAPHGSRPHPTLPGRPRRLGRARR